MLDIALGYKSDASAKVPYIWDFSWPVGGNSSGCKKS